MSSLCWVYREEKTCLFSSQVSRWREPHGAAADRGTRNSPFHVCTRWRCLDPRLGADTLIWWAAEKGGDQWTLHVAGVWLVLVKRWSMVDGFPKWRHPSLPSHKLFAMWLCYFLLKRWCLFSLFLNWGWLHVLLWPIKCDRNDIGLVASFKRFYSCFHTLGILLLRMLPWAHHSVRNVERLHVVNISVPRWQPSWAQPSPASGQPATWVQPGKNHPGNPQDPEKTMSCWTMNHVNEYLHNLVSVFLQFNFLPPTLYVTWGINFHKY